MALPDEPNFDELKRLLRRLENVLPEPQTIGVPPAGRETMSETAPVPFPVLAAGPSVALAPYPEAAPFRGELQSATSAIAVPASPAGESGRESRRSASRGTLITIVVAAAVSASLSTAISIVVLRGMNAQDPPGSTATSQQASPHEEHNRFETASTPEQPAAAEVGAPVLATTAAATETPPAPPVTEPERPALPQPEMQSLPTHSPPPENSQPAEIARESAPPETAATRSAETPPASTEAAAEPSPEPTPPAATAPFAPSPAPEFVQSLHRGKQMLSNGNIGAARVLLERAAELGSGEAAFALAATYDPAHDPSPRADGGTHNVLLARRWYERAAMLGEEEARRRLIDLDRRAAVPGGENQ